MTETERRQIIALVKDVYKRQKQVYGQVLRIFQVLLGDFLHVRSQETVGNVGVVLTLPKRKKLPKKK